MSSLTQESVANYYGKVLSKSSDLKTNACTTSGAPPAYIRKAIGNVAPEVVQTYYGCGLVVPERLNGANIVDLGSGSGRDCFVLAQLAGPKGKVVGVDMTEEQLAIADRGNDHHSEKSNNRWAECDFVKGYIESFTENLPKDMVGNVDVIVSNCVINLSPDKRSVLKECFKALKPGGELYFSDVYASKRMPQSLKDDEVLWGECISGALYWNDFLSIAKECGFGDPRLVSDSRITINNKALEEKCEGINFYSATYRLFKLPDLEPDCEDYGQAVIYKGTVPHHPKAFILDGHHKIETGRVFPVCGNTWRMLHDTRFRDDFDFIGTFDNHFGIFPGCGKDIPFSSKEETVGAGGGGGCC